MIAKINKSDCIRSLKNFENSKQTSINNKSKGMVVREVWITMANANKSTKPDEILFCKFVT